MHAGGSSSWRLAEHCEAITLENGLNRRTMDPLHAYEEGVNHESLMSWWNHGDPVHVTRCLEAAASLRALTTVTPSGHRHFKSQCYTGSYATRNKYNHSHACSWAGPGTDFAASQVAVSADGLLAALHWRGICTVGSSSRSGREPWRAGSPQPAARIRRSAPPDRFDCSAV